MRRHPPTRRLRILSFDPSLGTRLDTLAINDLTVGIPWEDNLQVGPIGEYVEVIDADPASRGFYHPVDLNDPYLLAQDGLPPSESNPQFHQQMVFAVAMVTIRHFERALGRTALWADQKTKLPDGKYHHQFVRRLRMYPHALRDRNAYYSPSQKALLFGYFPVTSKDAHNTPGTVVFTCLSHDIIAHEVTHALLDGVHPRFTEPTNPDVRAFHEAFADIVALFQHFTYPAVLESQIRRTRGSLDTENLLAQLAQQFGRATGRGAALRDALGSTNPETGQWEPRQPDPKALETTVNPHPRGAILVAAVFRAFLLMYRARTADLFRLASQGTGVLPAGDLHPDLTRRLAIEAAWTADRVLQMCIRAIDYCPPVDITFGDFLRGIITADLDYQPNDESGIRVVFIETFREWGIYPRGVRSLGIDALVWPTGDEIYDDAVGDRSVIHSQTDLKPDLERFIESAAERWGLDRDRYEVWKELRRVRAALWKWLRDGDSYGRDYARLFGLVIENAPPTVHRNEDGPTIEVHSVRPALRRSIGGGRDRIDLVVEITQRRHGYFDPDEQRRRDDPGDPRNQKQHKGDFFYRAGSTILIDPETAEIRRVIRTPGTIANVHVLARVRNYLTGKASVVGNAFDAGLPESLVTVDPTGRYEPFALLHQLAED